MSTSTTRAALTKPSGSASPLEVVDVAVLNTNSDLIDKFLGCILVNDGVTPSNSDLFDGAIVKEKTSGIIWEARKNGGGGFDKYYIRYPLHFQGYKAAVQTVATGTAFGTANIDTVNAALCINTSAAQITVNRFTAPVKGIYKFWLRVSFVNNAVGDRALGYELNGVTVAGSEYQIFRTGASSGAQECGLDISGTTVLAVNDTVAPSIWQNSGGNLNLNSIFVKLALIEPRF